jgi:hypothetical protein
VPCGIQRRVLSSEYSRRVSALLESAMTVPAMKGHLSWARVEEFVLGHWLAEEAVVVCVH